MNTSNGLFGYQTFDSFASNKFSNPSKEDGIHKHLFESNEASTLQWFAKQTSKHKVAAFIISNRYDVGVTLLRTLDPKAALKTYFLIQRITPQLTDNLYSLFSEIFQNGFQTQIPGEQESILVKLILDAPETKRRTLMEICSRFNFKYGVELFLAAVELLEKLPSDQCLEFWNTLKAMPAAESSEEPKCIAAANDTAFEARFSVDPARTYESMDPKNPRLLLKVVQGLYKQEKYAEALVYALKYVSESSDEDTKKRRVLKKVTLKHSSPAALEHPYLKDDTDFLLERVAISEKPHLHLEALMEHPEGAAKALEIIEECKFSRYHADYDRVFLFTMTHGRADLALKVFQTKTTWNPSAEVVAHLAHFSVTDNLEQVAVRIYSAATKDEQETLCRHFAQQNTHLNKWIPRFSEFTSLGDDQLARMSASNSDSALNIFGALHGKEVKNRWANYIFKKDPLKALPMIKAGASVFFDEKILDIAIDTPKANLAWQLYYERFGLSHDVITTYMMYSELMTEEQYDNLINLMLSLRHKAMYLPALVLALKSQSDAAELYSRIVDSTVRSEFAQAVYQQNPVFTVSFILNRLPGYPFDEQQLALSLAENDLETRILAWNAYCSLNILRTQYIELYQRFFPVFSERDYQAIAGAIDFEELMPKNFGIFSSMIESAGKGIITRVNNFDALIQDHLDNSNAQGLLVNIFTVYIPNRTADALNTAFTIYCALKDKFQCFDILEGMVKAMKIHPSVNELELRSILVSEQRALDQKKVRMTGKGKLL